MYLQSLKTQKSCSYVHVTSMILELGNSVREKRRILTFEMVTSVGNYYFLELYSLISSISENGILYIPKLISSPIRSKS